MVDFMKCIVQKLEEKNYGRKRIGEIMELYERYRNENLRTMNENDAALRASEKTIIEMQFRVEARLKATRKNESVIGSFNNTIEKSKTIKTAYGKRDIADKLVRAPMSMIEDDPRLTGPNFESKQRFYAAKYRALMSDVLDSFSKGAFGRQIGAAHFPNIVRELFGETTSDAAAKSVAQAYMRLQKVMVKDFNLAGGIMRMLDNFHLPQGSSAVRMIKAGKDAWVKAHVDYVDWTRTLWPDGTPIPEADRVRMLGEVFNAHTTNGYDSIDVKLGGGQGRSIGNQLEMNRFIHYKDAASWVAAHDAYADGSVYDTITRHIEGMAYKNALVDVFGTNPSAMMKTLVSATRKAAADVQKAGGNKYRGAAHATLDVDKPLRRFSVMADSALRHNAMDPENTLSTIVSTTQSLASAAMLKAATFAAMSGDLLTTLAVRFAQHQSTVGFLGEYLKAMFPGGYRTSMARAARAGFASDELFSNRFVAARLGLVSEFAPAKTKVISDAAMRITLMSRHTNALRTANQHEMMANLWHMKDKTIDQVPYAMLMRRAGITAEEWDHVRKNLTPWQPGAEANLMRPFDILNMKGMAATDLRNTAYKFHSMIYNESARMVPFTTREARASLAGGSRPETIPGAILHSFSMFKGYPVSYGMIYGRLVMSLEDNVQRTKLAAALGLGGVMAGALAIQMREIANGKNPQPMDNPVFWARALASGGALSIWGDFITAGIHGDPSAMSISDVAMGPLVSELSDAYALVAGGAFQYVGLTDRSTAFSSSKIGVRAMEFLQRNVLPGTWATNMILQRDIFDQVELWLDPVGTRRMWQGRMNRQKRLYGNDYYIKPGERIGF